MASTTGAYARLVALAALLPLANAGCYRSGLLYDDLHGNLPGDRLDMDAEIKANINTVCDKIAGAEFKKTDPASPPFTHCSNWEVTLESPDDCCDGAYCPPRCLGPPIGSFNRIEFEVALKDDSQTTTMKKEWCIAAFELELSGCSSGSEQDDDNGFWYRIDPQSGGCPAPTTPEDTPPASAEPTTMVTATSTTASTVPSPPGTLAGPYPGRQTINEFGYQGYDQNIPVDRGMQTLVHNAFVQDWSYVIDDAIKCAQNPNDPTINRWFPQSTGSTDSRTYVVNVFDRLLRPSTRNSAARPRSIVSDFVSVRQDWNNWCGTENAYFHGPSGAFHICEDALNNYNTKARENRCEDLGTRVSEQMMSVTGLQVHEFCHSYEVGPRVPNSQGHIEDIEWGPGQSHRLAKGQIQGKSAVQAFISADNYMYFALNAYYNKACGWQFGDPL